MIIEILKMVNKISQQLNEIAVAQDILSDEINSLRSELAEFQGYAIKVMEKDIELEKLIDPVH